MCESVRVLHLLVYAVPTLLMGYAVSTQVYAEEGVTDKEFDLVDDEGERGKATISLRFTYRPVQSVGEVTVCSSLSHTHTCGWRTHTGTCTCK